MNSANNYVNLTAHNTVQTAEKAEKKAPKYKPKMSNHAVPALNQVFELDLNYLIQDDKSRTPMVKMRCVDGVWTLVPRSQAGMFIFFESEVLSTHTKFRIVRILPSHTAAYAKSE